MHSKIQNLLRKLEKTQTEFWNIGQKTGFFINTIIKENNLKKVLEIGTSNGYSGIWIAEALKETDGHLWTIESHKERFALAKENFKKAGIQKQITQIQGHAPEAIPKTPKYFDLAFLDATKYEHLDYFKHLQTRIKKKGIVITDNINSHREELANYIQKIKALKDWSSIEFGLDSGILVSIKN